MNRPEPFAASKSADALTIQFLGRFRCFDRSGSELSVRSRKARALLAFVAANAQPVTRERLTALLWSSRGEEQARASLRQTLFELRRLTGKRQPLQTGDREALGLDGWSLSTDLQLIAAAAEEDNAGELVALLKRGEPGLLTDLYGLDPEYDSWLRTLGAEEPSRTMSLALAAAERRLEQSDLAAAKAIASEVMRIDPTNEEGVRLAMRIDHAAGDRSALHRHYSQFQHHMREELDASPSSETEELFVALSGARQAAAPITDAPPAVELGDAKGTARRQWPAIAAILLLVIAVGLAWLWATRPAPAEPPLMLAVLPFEAEPSDNNFVAAGLWEQTRAALTRNPTIKVLGRTTTTALAEQGLPAAQYRRRLGVTHLLEGTLRRSGDTVAVSISLSRTSDGVVIWHDVFRGKINEPMALQDAIADGIEGRLRARLAPQGGRRPEQIATTLEVQALYSEARSLISAREPMSYRRAEALLRDAIRKDPNYAPAWSLLGAAIHFNSRLAIADSKALAEARSAVGRSLALAPNLAQAHATMALLNGDNSPEAEAPLRRAVALDPNYAEAWNWLGNSLNSQSRRREALAAYERSLSLDPLFPSPVRNFANTAAELGDRAALAQLANRLERIGAEPILKNIVSLESYRVSGDHSRALALLSRIGLDADGRSPPRLWNNWLETLTAMSLFDAMHGVTGCPEWYAPMLQSRALPPKNYGGRPIAPGEFFTSQYFSTPASRAMIHLGKSQELVRLYRAGYPTPDDFISATERRGLLPELAPSLAIALQSVGDNEEARYVLAAAARRLAVIVSRPGTAGPRSTLAMIRAVQGQSDAAIALLDSARRAGWFPNGRTTTVDLAKEPAFEALRGNPRFEVIRSHYLGHSARERAEAEPFVTRLGLSS